MAAVRINVELSVARMKRSEIRGCPICGQSCPGLRFAASGLRADRCVSQFKPRAPRTSLPGRAPVALPSRWVTMPDTMVAS
ncbi:hypothetical protein AB7M56_007664 [Bradyrhizobium elkanii]